MTIDILRKWNPWEKEIDAGIKREQYIRKIYSYIERKEILVLKGIRRSGKSTIIRQLICEMIKKGINRKQILYLNLEDYGFADRLSINLFDDVLASYKGYTKNKKKTYFFIDEAQKIPSWEKWVRTKYDLSEDIKFIVSGSSASLLSKELSTLLTGRNLSFTIMPLSFSEYAFFTGNKGLDGYMKYGGFPEIVLEKSEEKKAFILQQYFEDIIYKDIIDRHSIRNTKQIMDLARYLVSASGAKTSVNKLSKMFGIAKDTLQAYINYMIDAYLLFEVTYFSYSAKVRHDVTKLPKLYCLDLGLIGVVNVKYSKNVGQAYENTVLIRLAARYAEISYWCELESEVDFIVERTAINVTSTDKLPERETSGLEHFSRKHKGFDLIIISKSLREDKIIPLIEYLSEEE